VALAERHRGHISRWFYPCSPRMHRGLGDLYIADERFTNTYENQAKGLAAYLHDAIAANADAQEQAAVSR
jgi:MerR family transcriptional regulator, thiopeptide resistance regulator